MLLFQITCRAAFVSAIISLFAVAPTAAQSGGSPQESRTAYCLVKTAPANTRGQFVTQGKATVWVPARPSSKAATPSCCVGGNCCKGGSCCSVAGCCKADKSCCDPASGICNSTCGCSTNGCCDAKAASPKPMTCCVKP